MIVHQHTARLFRIETVRPCSFITVFSPAQIGPGQVGPRQDGQPQVGLLQFGLLQVGPTQVDVAQVGLAQVNRAAAGLQLPKKQNAETHPGIN